jgi:GntR family transcriptional regulator
MTIDRDGFKAPYEQLADLLRERIARGEFPLGQLIPSHHQLDAEYGLSRNTTAKAVRVLVDEGLVKTAPGRGMFVVKIPDAPGHE